MLDTSPEIQAPSSPRRNTVRLLQQLREAGEPIVLTVNGKLELVVEDDTSYQKLLELVDRIETVEALRESLKDEAEGRVVSLDEVRERAQRK
jgi:PHD/YefM family antitoxin component YafN of YafNO toxin-antitoxin module